MHAWDKLHLVVSFILLFHVEFHMTIQVITIIRLFTEAVS